MNTVFPGSHPEKSWDKFVKRFSLSKASDFYGIVFGDTGFSYRRGYPSTVKGRKTGQIYWRISWKNPLDTKHASLFEYVIFHAPKTPESSEVFYIVHRREIAKLIAAKPGIKNILNLPSYYRNPTKSGDWRQKIMDNPIAPKKLLAHLRHLTAGNS